MNTNLLRYRVKVCGITQLKDAECAIDCGADALGFIIGAESQRKISYEKANTIIKKLPPFVTKVGLMVNQPFKTVQEVIDKLELNILQFHGDETPEFCNSFQLPYIKALRVTEIQGIDKSINHWINSGAKAVLLDNYHPSKFGGTGETIKTDKQKYNFNQPVILAGGLNPSNIKKMVDTFKPYAVDVNSGIEIQPGIKDHHLMKLFFQNLNKLNSI